MSDLHDLFSVPPDGGRHMIPVAIQPIGALERSLMRADALRPPLPARCSPKG